MNAKDDYRRRNDERERRRQDAQARKGFGRRTFRNPDRMIRFTWWVAAFTMCLAIVGGVQAYAFIQSERAFLLPVSAHFEGVALAPDKPIQLWLEIKNSGHSTAVVSRLNVSYGSRGLPEFPKYSRDASIALSPIIGGSIVPTNVKAIHPDGQAFSLQKPVIDAIQDQTLRFFVFGFIEYHDDFSWLWLGRSRQTGFCYIYNPKGIGSTFDPCPEQNYTYAY